MSLAHSQNLAQLRLQCRNRRGDAKGERARERERRGREASARKWCAAGRFAFWSYCSLLRFYRGVNGKEYLTLFIRVINNGSLAFFLFLNFFFSNLWFSESLAIFFQNFKAFWGDQNYTFKKKRKFPTFSIFFFGSPSDENSSHIKNFIGD
jgi:hypothetical protein